MQESSENKEENMDLLKDSIRKLYFKFLIPSLGSAMVMSIYTLTDAIVIGKGVGADALAALSITTPLLCILMALGILFGVGGSVAVSVHRGTGDNVKADSFFTLSFIMISVITLILWIVYNVGTPVFIRLMGANDTLYPYEVSYMRWINIFLPVAVFSNYIAIFIRADNDPNRAMLGVMLGGVANIVLDIVLVFPLKCGMAGAAIASCIGMVLQVTVGTTHFLSKKNKLHLVKPRDTVATMWLIVSNGIPSFFNEFANGFIVFLFNIQILKYCGESALSVYSVISNCVILFNSLFTGVGQSIQPVISTNFGAGCTDRIKQVKKMAYITAGVMGTVFTLSGVLLPDAVCGIFMKMTDELSGIAGYGLRMYFIAFLPFGINLLTSYYFQAIIKTKQSLCISLVRNIFLSGICIILFPIVFGGASLWCVMPFVELATLVLSIILLRTAKLK